MTKYLEFRNISTILTSILLTICGALLGYLSSIGLNLPITAEALASIICAIILAVFSYYNAKNQNTLFDEDTDTLNIDVSGLTDNQVTAIQNFIDEAEKTNQQYTDIDPASEYEDGGC